MKNTAGSPNRRLPAKPPKLPTPGKLSKIKLKSPPEDPDTGRPVSNTQTMTLIILLFWSRKNVRPGKIKYKHWRRVDIREFPNKYVLNNLIEIIIGKTCTT